MVSNTKALADLTRRQQDAVDFDGGNVLVEAVPGSGKTRLIVARCESLLTEGVSASEILLLTFSRRAVGELRERLACDLEPAKMPEIRTFHGFAARLLADAGEGGHSRRLLTEPSERALFERTVKTMSLQSLQDGVVRSPLFRETASARVAELRRAPLRALTTLAADPRATLRIKDLIELEAEQRRLRADLGVADYDDLVARAVTLARKPGSAVASALRGRYRHVLVDEFQDTDALQLELLQCLDATVFAVGDAAQAIYGFRGAARDALGRASEALAMARLPLAESFRCPENVCTLARAVQPKSTLTSRANRSGELLFRRAAAPYDEAAFIGDRIAAALADGTPAREIGVLVRAVEPMARLVERDLRSRGIPVARQGGENVLDDPAVDAISAALEALLKADEPASWERLLGHPALGIAPLALRLMLDASPPRSVEDACALVERSNLTARVDCTRLAAALRAARERWLANDPVGAGREFAAQADVLGYVIEHDENAIRRSSAGITSFFTGLADMRYVHERLGLDVSSGALVEAFFLCSDAWHAPGATIDGEEGVRVLTIHAAKGLEFAFVVIADAVEDRFPQAWRPDALLSAEELTIARDCGVDLGVRTEEHDREERSLWYVAATRTRRTLLVTWSETALDGAPQRPSRFIPLDERTREGGCKSFRAIPSYDAAPTLPDPQFKIPAQLIRPVPATALETWLSCRRKFYYAKLLRIESDGSSFPVKLGVLVHAAIERFHIATRDFHGVAEHASVAWSAALCELARGLLAPAEITDARLAKKAGYVVAFDTTLERAAVLRAADRLLERYARNLETSSRAPDGAFEVAAIEEKIAFTVEEIEFSGKIDRIDRRDDGTFALVDVKTGKPKKMDSVPSYVKLAAAVANNSLREKPPAPGNPQLPLYRHAKPGTSMLTYLYLGAASKHDEYEDVAYADRLDVVADAAALEAIEEVLHRTFFQPWNDDAVLELESTKIARTCMTCDFKRVCPGFLEEDE